MVMENIQKIKRNLKRSFRENNLGIMDLRITTLGIRTIKIHFNNFKG